MTTLLSKIRGWRKIGAWVIINALAFVGLGLGWVGDVTWASVATTTTLALFGANYLSKKYTPPQLHTSISPQILD